MRSVWRISYKLTNLDEQSIKWIEENANVQSTGEGGTVYTIYRNFKDIPIEIAEVIEQSGEEYVDFNIF